MKLIIQEKITKSKVFSWGQVEYINNFLNQQNKTHKLGKKCKWHPLSVAKIHFGPLILLSINWVF